MLEVTDHKKLTEVTDLIGEIQDGMILAGNKLGNYFGGKIKLRDFCGESRVANFNSYLRFFPAMICSMDIQ